MSDNIEDDLKEQAKAHYDEEKKYLSDVVNLFHLVNSKIKNIGLRYDLGIAFDRIFRWPPKKFHRIGEPTINDIQWVVDSWNEMTIRCPNIRPVLRLSQRRCHSIIDLLEGLYDPNDWGIILNNLEKSHFLNGYNKIGFVATFDWVINHEKGAPERILEGQWGEPHEH